MIYKGCFLIWTEYNWMSWLFEMFFFHFVVNCSQWYFKIPGCLSLAHVSTLHQLYCPVELFFCVATIGSCPCRPSVVSHHFWLVVSRSVYIVPAKKEYRSSNYYWIFTNINAWEHITTQRVVRYDMVLVGLGFGYTLSVPLHGPSPPFLTP